MVRERETARTTDLSLRLLGGVVLRLRDGRRRENRGQERKRQGVEHRKGTERSFFLWETKGEGLRPSDETGIETVSPPTRRTGSWVQEGKGGLGHESCLLSTGP
jgi:hypothetical protein